MVNLAYQHYISDSNSRYSNGSYFLWLSKKYVKSVITLLITKFLRWSNMLVIAQRSETVFFLLTRKSSSKCDKRLPETSIQNLSKSWWTLTRKLAQINYICSGILGGALSCSERRTVYFELLSAPHRFIRVAQNYLKELLSSAQRRSWTTKIGSKNN